MQLVLLSHSKWNMTLKESSLDLGPISTKTLHSLSRKSKWKYIPSGAPQNISQDWSLTLHDFAVKTEGSSKYPKKVSYKKPTVSQPHPYEPQEPPVGPGTSNFTEFTWRLESIGYPKEIFGIGNLQISSALGVFQYMLQCVSFHFFGLTYVYDWYPYPHDTNDQRILHLLMYIYIHTHITL